MAKAPTSSSAPPAKPRAAKPRAFERPRGGEARRISDMMPDIGRAAFRKFGFVQNSVVTRWEEIVGERFAAITQPDMIRFPVAEQKAGHRAGGTLHLTISGAHAPMLQHAEPELIARVNRFFGYAAVAKIRMTQGRITPRADPVPAVQPSAMLRPIPAELGDSLRDIGDPELRTVLENLATALVAPVRLPKVR